MRASTAPAGDAGANPLLAPWTGPHGGVPPFDRVAVADIAPALEAAMAEQLAEIERIAADPAPPTFENTIAALERTGRTLDRVGAVYGVWSSAMSGPEFQAVEREMAPRLAAFADRITQHVALFRRVQAVHAGPELPRLSAEARRLVWRLHADFVRAGARLEPAAKARLSAINQRLAALYTTFAQHVLHDETEQALVLREPGELAGLPASLRAALAEAARARGIDGAWAVANTRSAMDPFLTHSTRRDLRERAWRLFVGRGDAGATDNAPVAAEILRLRAERARLLGHATHAHWRLEDAMAGAPERALALLEAVWPAAVARVREEVADMQALADREADALGVERQPIAPWDYRFWAEQVRLARYDLDDAQVKPYLQLERLREGMFWVAGELFGLDFRPVDDVPVYHPDVRVWAVAEREGGRHVGLWYFDPFARAGKRSGAWMNAYRAQERLDAPVPTIVSNNANFVAGAAGEPVLVSWDDARTLFHEFGHALHGLLSDVTYPTLSGTRVPRDYVEFPSQLLEHWLETPEVLRRFAVHHETGQPIPRELVARLARAATFNQGFATVEYLASALVDLRLHLADERGLDPRALEEATLAALGMPAEVGMRHRTPHFLHVFSGDGYSAAYYSYLWADVLTADAAEAFAAAPGGMYDRTLAERLRAHVFTRGNTLDPAEGYRAFRGRDPEVGALMRKRGFPEHAGGGGTGE